MCMHSFGWKHGDVMFWLLTVLVLSASGGTKLGHITGRWNDHPDDTSIRGHSGSGIAGRSRSGSFSGDAAGSYCHHGTQQVEAGVGDKRDCRSVLRDAMYSSSSELTVRAAFKLIRHWRQDGFVFCSPGSRASRLLGMLSKHSNTELTVLWFLISSHQGKLSPLPFRDI